MPWQKIHSIETERYRCGFCDREVASADGWPNFRRESTAGFDRTVGTIAICPNCDAPTYFDKRRSEQVPGPRILARVASLPEDVNALYEEARRSYAANAHTAVVLCCRKILMHVAIEKGAAEDLSFKAYVEYLDKKNLIGEGGKGWVDRIKDRGNHANHQIIVMSATDSLEVLTFTQMLLKLVYEFPSLLPKPSA